MMAAMLTQVPLPWLPGDAEEIAPGVGVVVGDGDGGGAGLGPARKGPRAAWKLTPELAERIAELDAGGRKLAAIAAECGVSTFTVRTALGRVPARRAEDPAAAGAASRR